MHASPGGILSSSQQLKLQEPLPSLVMLPDEKGGRALAALTVAMKRELL